ncbi:MAG: hypothetical protein E6G69_07240 [Alphaproteobacteria bacterium]|nr:MAG: hypothetical protein E6G69_07240 [Alphaproteobacteria bacterium]
MIVRKTLEQAKAEGGRFNKEKFDSFTDADIERMIDEDPDLAPRNEEREFTPADPVLQALLRILDRMPKSALRALDQRPRKAG